MSDPFAGPSGGGRPIRILLYTLIPVTRELEPIGRSPFAFVRNRLRRVLELAAWRVTGVWRAHYSTFEDRANSNRGDMAIRVGARRQLERVFAGRSLAIDEVAWGDLDAAINGAQAPYDLIVIAGGGYLFADPEGRLPQRFAADVGALSRTSTPAVAISIGLNHLIMPGEAQPSAAFHPDQHDLIRRFIDRIDLMSLRDDATREALAAVDPACGRVIVDPAFLLVSTFDARRNQARDQPLAVGLNMAFHGAHATVINRHLLRETAEALSSFAASTPVRFTYFIHSNSERAIVAALRLWGLSIEVIDGDVDMMLAAYKQQDLHVGQMLHSTIFAMAVGVPALGVAYDIKSRAFFDLFGLGAYCLDATTADRHALLAAMCRLAADRQKIAVTIAARGAALRADAAGFYRRIGDAVMSVIAPPPETWVWRGGPGLTRRNEAFMSPDNGTPPYERGFERAFEPITVSTVVPALNAEGFVARAIESALNQSIPGCEVIVVDDGSTDATCRIVESYRHRGVRLVRHDRRTGAAAARNTGVAAARGEYVAFLDADDEWLPGKLQRQLALLRSDAAMSFVSCRANLLDEDGRDTGDIYRGAAPAEGAAAWRTLLAHPCVATPSVLARRTALQAAGGFNRWMRVAEDQDMWIRLALLGPVGHVPESLVRVYSTPGSLSKARFREQAGYVLPMVFAYVERNRHRLTEPEARAILGERFGKLGQLAYAAGEYGFGASTLLRAIALGHQPLGHLLYMVKASSLMRGLKRLAQTGARD